MRKLSTRDSLIAHSQICKEKKKTEFEIMKEKYEKDIVNDRHDYEEKLSQKDLYYQQKLAEKDEYSMSLKHVIEKLETKLQKFEDAIVDIAARSGKPSITTNNTNIVMSTSLNLHDTVRIRGIIEDGLTKNVVCNGQRGLAKFVVDNILKDAEGKLMYKCVDPSRHSFEFTNSDGIVEKDVRAAKLKRALIDGDVIVRAKKSGDDLWLREDGSMDNDRYVASGGKVMEIMTLDREDTKFRTELSALTS
jgi:hypothetical protein